ncbi:hypothetical protein K502DRAFT_326370 [Neoconidiobolus thromboides FSU 785]|nr:hypothetical protein K502DRAFT_326370 [Neoconidiobolus thromboides FSU 785]
MFNINLEPISSPNSFDLTSGTIASPTLSSNILNQLNENDIRNLNYFFINVNNNLNLINQSYLVNQLTLNQHEFHLIHMLTLMIKVTKWHSNIEQSEANTIIYQFKNMIDWMSIYSVNNTDPNLNIILPAINTLNELLKFIHWRCQIQLY